MSGITTIAIKVGEYKCGECLKSALGLLNLNRYLSIIQNSDAFQISLQEQTREFRATEVKHTLSQKIRECHLQILPKYAELHAIHSLTQKGFRHVKTYELENAYKMIFEKIVGAGAQERIDRYEITVFPNENRILIDGGDMPGNYCRQNAKNFQQSMGEFKGFTANNSEEATYIRNKVQIKQKQTISKK